MAKSGKKLYRSRTNRIIFGVCGGLAAYFNIETALVRLVFVIFGLFNGLGVLVYLALFVLAPLEPGEDIEVDSGQQFRKTIKDLEQKSEKIAQEVRKTARSIKDEFKKDSDKDSDSERK